MRIGVSLPAVDLGADLRAIGRFAATAERLGFSHLRVGDQQIRPDGGPAHEPLTLLAYIAAVTERIELTTTVLVVPARTTLLVAKQTAELDCLSNGRFRLGVGIGRHAPVYEASGQAFSNRGARLEEQIELLRQFWTQPQVEFNGRYEQVSGRGLNPLPVQRPIPIWYGANRYPKPRVMDRIARVADGWFAICPLDAFANLRDDLRRRAVAAGRDPATVQIEAQMRFPNETPDRWLNELQGWRDAGVERIAVRAPGPGLDGQTHFESLEVLSRLTNRI